MTIDLTIVRTRSTHHDGDKEVEEMAKERVKRKSQTIKLLKKAQTNYEK